MTVGMMTQARKATAAASAKKAHAQRYLDVKAARDAAAAPSRPPNSEGVTVDIAFRAAQEAARRTQQQAIAQAARARAAQATLPVVQHRVSQVEARAATMMVSDKFIEDVRRQHVADRRVERATNRQKIRRAPRGFKLGPFGELQKKATVTSRGSPRSQSIKAQKTCFL